MAHPQQNRSSIPETAPEQARPRPMGDGVPFIPDGESPAIRLQRQVADAYNAGDRKWSARRTLAFIVLVCGAFWMLLFAGLRAFTG